VEAYDSLVRHLAAETHEVEADTPSLARQAAIEAIRLPQVVQLDNLLGLAAIQQLEQTQPLLLELLKIFAEGSPAAYTQFHDSHPGFLESLGAPPVSRKTEQACAYALCSLTRVTNHNQG